MKILAFGASVTAQKFHHETGALTGYVEALRKLGHLTGHKQLVRVAYAGNRASDAGLVRMADVVAEQPDVVLFEANVESERRGRPVSQPELAWLYRQMLDTGALPITLFLCDPKRPDPTALRNYQNIQPFCAANGLPTIEIDLRHEPTLEGYFRGVHTLEPGARLIADRVAQALSQLDISAKGRDKLRAQIAEFDSPIAVTKLDDTAAMTQQTASFPLNVTQTSHIRVLQRHKVGPWSPVIDVRVGGRPAEQTCLFDPACHFERQTFVVLYEGPADPGDRIEVSISDTDPDYGICDRPISACPKSDRKVEPVSDLWVIYDPETKQAGVAA